MRDPISELFRKLELIFREHNFRPTELHVHPETAMDLEDSNLFYHGPPGPTLDTPAGPLRIVKCDAIMRGDFQLRTDARQHTVRIDKTGPIL